MTVRCRRSARRVVEAANGQPPRRVRGVISRSQIERRLGASLDITPIASSVSAIEQALVWVRRVGCPRRGRSALSATTSRATPNAWPSAAAHSTVAVSLRAGAVGVGGGAVARPNVSVPSSIRPKRRVIRSSR